MTRDAALGQCRIRLVELGFSESAKRWSKLINVDGSKIKLSVVFPNQFPYALPDIYVLRECLPRRIPHVDRNGKICIGHSDAISIDFRNPTAILAWALQEAKKILSDGLSGRNEEDFYTEYLSYWEEDSAYVIELCFDPGGRSRKIELLAIEPPLPIKGARRFVAANSRESLEVWIRSMSYKPLIRECAWYHVLTKRFPPPDFDEALRFRDISSRIRDNSSTQDYQAMMNWLTKCEFRAHLLISIPGTAEGHIVLGAYFPGLSRERNKILQSGFRHGKVPESRKSDFYENIPCRRIRVARMDAGYMLARASSNRQLREKTVLIAGCGALGSMLAAHLAMAGVGNIRLVDPDSVSPANVYRSQLPARMVGIPKVMALEIYLKGRFPHLKCQTDCERVEDILLPKDSITKGVDLLVFAVDDETSQLRLNDALGSLVPRLHIWIETMGIGGHLLATGFDQPGCFRCLFGGIDAWSGNRANFAKPGQVFQRTLSGCDGTHTPFPGLHAANVALRASQEAINVLLGNREEPVLVSWIDDPEEFLATGLELSDRAHGFPVKTWKEDSQFAAKSCLCGFYGEEGDIS